MTTEPLEAPSVLDDAPPAATMKSRRRLLVGYAVRRIVFIPIGAAFLVTLSYFVINLIPSNPGAQMLGNLATPAEVDRINADLGFNKSVWARFADYVSHLVHGDLGISYFSKTKVSTEIGHHLPNTVELVLPSLLISFALGVLLALVAVRGPRGVRSVANLTLTLFQSVPDFFLAVVLIYVLFARTGVLPAPVGQNDLGAAAPDRITGMQVLDAMLTGRWGLVGPLLAHLVLPVVTLSLALMPLFGRIARAGMQRAWETPYVEFGRANGLGPGRIFTFVLQDIRGSLLTYVVTALAALIGGAAIVETIFSWNGLGQWIVGSVTQLDLPAIEGFVVVITLASLALYLVLDILVAVLDPRIELGRRSS